jgi:hypothetical protein
MNIFSTEQSKFSHEPLSNNRVGEAQDDQALREERRLPSRSLVASAVRSRLREAGLACAPPRAKREGSG